MAEYAHKALPGLQLFLAQRAREVFNHQQPMREAAFAERSSAHAPTAGAAGERAVDHLRGSAAEIFVEAEVGRAAAEELDGGGLQKILTGTIDQA